MSLQDRIQALRVKHAELEADIQQEGARPWPDEVHLTDLKRQKLRIKDMIAQLSRQAAEEPVAGMLQKSGENLTRLRAHS